MAVVVLVVVVVVFVVVDVVSLLFLHLLDRNERKSLPTFSAFINTNKQIIEQPIRFIIK